MTLAELITIRNFLMKVVVRGPEEEELIRIVERINHLLRTNQAA
jgi:hypothetical protein